MTEETIKSGNLYRVKLPSNRQVYFIVFLPIDEDEVYGGFTIEQLHISDFFAPDFLEKLLYYGYIGSQRIRDGKWEFIQQISIPEEFIPPPMRVVRYSEDGLSLQYYKQYPKDRRLLPATREEVANLESGHVWYSGAYAAEIEVDDRISGKHLRIPITEYQVGRDIGSIHRAWEEGIPYEEYITKVRNRLKAIDFYKPIWNHFVVPLEGGEVEHLYEDVGFPEWLYGERYPWFVAIRFTAKGEIKERKPRQLSARSAKQLHAQVTSFLTGKKAAVAKWKWSKDKANFYIYAADKEIFSEQPPFNLQDFVNWDMETSIREDWNFEELEKVRPPKEVALAWLEKLLKKLELRAEKSKQRSKGKRTRKVDFYLYFKDRKSAKAFYEKVREKGFVLKSMRRVEFSKGFPISVILEKAYTRSAGEESLDINSLDELASEFDGEFDGTGREI